MSELKKCPFCGGEASAREFTEPFVNGWVGCQKCHCFIEWIKNGKSLAIAAWNRRADHSGEANNQLTLEELREMEGEPVWVMFEDGSGARWGIVSVCSLGVCAVVGDDDAYWFTDICKTVAYRRKPEPEGGEG